MNFTVSLKKRKILDSTKTRNSKNLLKPGTSFPDKNCVTLNVNKLFLY